MEQKTRQKRKPKFYRKNEKEVMEKLGLTPTKNSGSTWIEKGDGQNEMIICELKSTDKSSYRIQKSDLDKLEYQATASHKLPLFAIQFLESNDLYLLIRPEQIGEIVKGLDKKVEQKQELEKVFTFFEEPKTAPKRTEVKSNKKAREKFHDEKSKLYTKERKAK